MRTSLHIEPSGAAATARHYIRDLVYGANDGIITTFAVVSGVAGGQLSQLAVLVVGAANLAADGVSMGVGNFLAIRADERAREAEGLPELERHPWKHGLATLVAFVVAGAVPLIPYLFLRASPLAMSTIMTFSTLFVLGALRALVTRDRWWHTGLETLHWAPLSPAPRTLPDIWLYWLYVCDARTNGWIYGHLHSRPHRSPPSRARAATTRMGLAG